VQNYGVVFCTFLASKKAPTGYVRVVKQARVNASFSSLTAILGSDLIRMPLNASLLVVFLRIN
jgi:hypothetical protein